MENEEEEGDDWRVVKETSGKRARCLAAVIATAHHRRIPVFFQAAAAKRQSTRSLCHAHPDATAFLLRCPFSTRFLYSRNVIFRDTTARECVDCVSRTLTCRKCKPATLFWREADHLAELDWADEASGLTAVRVGCWVCVCVCVAIARRILLLYGRLIGLRPAANDLFFQCPSTGCHLLLETTLTRPVFQYFCNMELCRGWRELNCPMGVGELCLSVKWSARLERTPECWMDRYCHPTSPELKWRITGSESVAPLHQRHHLKTK